MELIDLLIFPNETIKSALEKMTKNRKGLLIVCNPNYHLAGVISDGDIRRALIDNILLTSTVGKIMNLSPIVAKSKEEAIELIKHTGYVIIPIVNEEGFVIGAGVLEKEEIKIIEAKEKIEKKKTEDILAVAIVPARGGSKRVPKKNIVKVAGRPLISWTLHQAKSSRYVDKIIVSTDDEEIAEVVKKSGIEVPFLRPKELAMDNVPTLDVVVHSISWLEENYPKKYKIGVLLEPTAPLRLPSNIDNAIEKLYLSDADSVVSVSEVPHTLNPEEVLTIEDGVLEPYAKGKTMDTRNLRGKQEPVYVQNGIVYAFKIESLLKYKSLYGKKSIPYILDWSFFLDIDTMEDIHMADFKLKRFFAKYIEEMEKDI